MTSITRRGALTTAAALALPSLAGAQARAVAPPPAELFFETR